MGQGRHPQDRCLGGVGERRPTARGGFALEHARPSTKNRRLHLCRRSMHGVVEATELGRPALGAGRRWQRPRRGCAPRRCSRHRGFEEVKVADGRGGFTSCAYRAFGGGRPSGS